MSNLSKLKIVAQAAKRQQTKSEHRRGKLLEKLGDQLAMICSPSAPVSQIFGCDLRRVLVSSL